VLRGAWAGVRVPWILAAHGCRCNWKHLALPITCLLPVKRARVRRPLETEATVQPVPNSSQTGVPG
jgi:hypothetical protein